MEESYDHSSFGQKQDRFVDGSYSKLDPSFPDFHHWIRCNNMVISWILNSLTKETSESVLFSSIAQEIWNELEERFGLSNGAQVYEVQKELSQSCQGACSITTYILYQDQEMWDKFQSLRTLPYCSCGSVQILQKFEEEQRLFQFLMGLKQFTAIHGNILMMKPLPSVAQAYSLLIQEEKQK